MFFLEMELIKDLVIVDMEGRGRSHLPRWVILGTGFSSRHIYRTGKTLVKIQSDIDIDWKNLPKLHGRKDDDWIAITVAQEFQIVLLIAEAREDMNFETKLVWKQEDDPEFHSIWHKRAQALKTSRRQVMEPLKQP